MPTSVACRESREVRNLVISGSLRQSFGLPHEDERGRVFIILAFIAAAFNLVSLRNDFGPSGLHQNDERMRLFASIIINSEKDLLNKVVMMAGVDGFEPPYDGIKNRCLTAWLHPKRND